MKPLVQFPLMCAVRRTAIVVGVLTLSACSSLFNPIGDNKYDCNRKENPNSPYCHSFKAVEASTTADLPDSRFDKEVKISDVDKLTGIAPDRKARPANMPTSEAVAAIATRLPHQVHAPVSLDGLPVRQGPVIQRILIKRYVDANDVLTEDTVVYQEVVPTHWSGFDVQTSYQSGNAMAYPHRPVLEAQDKSKGTGVRQALGTPDSGAPATAHPSEFSQPGAKPPAPDGQVSDPSYNGVSSMPQ